MHFYIWEIVIAKYHTKFYAFSIFFQMLIDVSLVRLLTYQFLFIHICLRSFLQRDAFSCLENTPWKIHRVFGFEIKTKKIQIWKAKNFGPNHIFKITKKFSKILIQFMKKWKFRKKTPNFWESANIQRSPGGSTDEKNHF